ncbi:hypothetical protein [Robbsia andropogonis]|uniref:hypothetical protein n=1 Tax=Robbsia andropogonis TaxID=28092 RepID=UPI002A6B04E6|nr:hypothetical protein [Robbsia andropogonis]
MAFTDPTTPNLADFTTFVYSQGVPQADLPADSDYLVWSFDIAKARTLVAPFSLPPILYVMAVYNLGMHTLVGLGQDLEGQTFFTTAREKFKFGSFAAGPVVSTGDNGSQTTLLAPEFLKNLTLQDLELLKTPWGRYYLAYAQQAGSTAFGVS